MKSCIYTGQIKHRRFKPISHEFEYKLFMMYLDLEELPTLFDNCSSWSYEKANYASWQRKHYLGPRDLSLREAVKFRIEDAGAEDPGGPVRMLTHLSYFGYCYNPVTFYYCFDKADKDLKVIIAEINNTPWKERHAYVMTDEADKSDTPDRKQFLHEKVFHVSPFMPMNANYDWRFTVPGDDLKVHMFDYIDNEKYFDALLTLSREEISSLSLKQALRNYPLMTTKVWCGIYYQALMLWMKKTPFYENPQPRKNGEKDFYDTIEMARKHRGGK